VKNEDFPTIGQQRCHILENKGEGWMPTRLHDDCCKDAHLWNKARGYFKCERRLEGLKRYEIQDLKFDV
jgi:hypothetical protein